MKKTITLGGKEYVYDINFNLSYEFLKYRNKITKGYDISNLDKKVLQEIAEVQEKVAKKEQEGIEDIDTFEFLSELSPEAMEFLTKNSNPTTDLFDMNEIFHIVSKFTKIDDNDKIVEILDEEIDEVGYDEFINKIINAISEVFINAKANSQQKMTSKVELNKVAK